MPVVSVNLSPTAYAIYSHWHPKSVGHPGRSYEVSNCIIAFPRVLLENKELKKEVELLKKDKEQLWKIVEEGKE
jgi:hypothetical protein